MSTTEKITVTVQDDGTRAVTAEQTIQWGTEKGPVVTVAEPMETSVPAAAEPMETDAPTFFINYSAELNDCPYD